MEILWYELIQKKLVKRATKNYDYKIIVQPKRFSMKVMFGAKSAAKKVCTTFTPPSRIVEKQ